MAEKAVNSVEDAICAASDQVLQASCQGTFSVGGVLLDSNGNILHQLHNNVVKNNLTFDPTAHGERQMIDWYNQNKASLPPPEELILVTSLDPCVMCTGSILETGIGSVVVAANDTFAGINYDETAMFPSLANTPMQAQAQASFAYPEVSGTTCFSRKASGAPLPAVFTDRIIMDQTFALTSTAFLATLSAVSTAINNDIDESELLNPKTLPDTDPIIENLKAVYGHALEYTAPALGQPSVGLAPYLIEQAQIDLQKGGEGNSVALLDRFGNLILCVPGNQGNSGIATPFMIATRSYAQLRYNLLLSGYQDTLKYLGHPKYGTFVYAKSIQINARGLVDLGAFGSTMEGAIPKDRVQFQYGVARETQADLDTLCDNLPPFYSNDDSVDVHIEQVADQNLINALQSGLPK